MPGAAAAKAGLSAAERPARHNPARDAGKAGYGEREKYTTLQGVKSSCLRRFS